MRSPAPRALLTTAAIAVSLAAADTYVVVLALTDMMRGVGVGIDSLQRATPIISGFLLGYVAVLPLIGRVADLVDRQRVLLACLGVFVVGSAVTALATDLPVLVTGRVVQGVGGGGLVPATLAIVAQLWPADRRGVPLGVVGAVQELGSVLGPVLGALVLVVAEWRAIFWINALLGALLAVAVVVTGGGRVPRPRPVVVALALVAAVAGWPGPRRPRRAGHRASRSVLPFVPFGDATSRLATPIGLVAAVFLLAALAVGGRGAWPLLRRADLLGAVLLGGALGCVVLTFAASEPATEVVGPLGYALLPVAAVLAGRVCRAPPALCLTAGAPRPGARTAASGRSSSRCSSGWRSSRSSSTCRCSRASCTRRARPRRPWCSSASSWPCRSGALAGGWALRRLGNGVVAAAGLALAAVGLAVMTTWGRGSLDDGVVDGGARRSPVSASGWPWPR